MLNGWESNSLLPISNGRDHPSKMPRCCPTSASISTSCDETSDVHIRNYIYVLYIEVPVQVTHNQYHSVLITLRVA